ncbi:MAG: fructose-6-phosphate aldolase [Nitrososphaerota archaeon]|nr:fructose-6-phosphate aldolase [Nitrososphaerota archaeon]MDG6922622.1 fructose-6-phosphate aldolase [Nitrososphaerota archaeon]
MKIFLDTANIEQIRKYNDLGLVDGVTTNPTLLSKENSDPKELMSEIVRTVGGPVSLEVISTDFEGMMDEARSLSKYGQNAVVKIPMTAEGLRAVKQLKKEGIRTNVTLIFSPNQALLAAKSGASYVSPFIGRLDDIGEVGMDVVRDIIQIFKNYSYETEVLVASVRHPLHVIDAAKLGADVVTLPPDVLGKMINHPLTDSGLAKFLDDWKKAKQSKIALTR